MVDVNLKVPALEKLLDYAASGIGAVAGPMLAPWRARRGAEAKLIEAKADADSLKLIADAQADARRALAAPGEAGRGMLDIGSGGIRHRIEFQEKKRQANIAAVVGNAAAGLGDKEVPDHEPDPDWTARFFDCVQDVSSEDMQKIWAKILAGEVETPGRTSLRTLSVLRNMSQDDARMFSEIMPYHIDGFIHSEFYKEASGDLRGFSLVMLEELGLCFGSSVTYTLELDETGKKIMECCNRAIAVFGNPGNKFIIDGAKTMNRVARDLIKFHDVDVNYQYLRQFSKLLASCGCEVQYSRFLLRFPEGMIGVRDEDLRVVEPAP